MLVLFQFSLLLYPIMAHCEQSKTDSLRLVLQMAPNDTVSIESSMLLGLEWESINFDSSMFYYNRALKFSEKSHRLDEKARVFINMGFLHRYSLDSELAMEYLLQALQIYLDTDNKKGQLDTYYNLGEFNSHFEHFSQSIEYYNLAIGLGIELNNQERLGMVYNNLGLIYNYIGDYDKANQFQFEALKIKEKINDNTIQLTQVNIGLNYLEQKNYEEALEHYHIALNMFNENNEKAYIAQTYKNIGDVYVEINDIKEAKNYYQQAFTIYKELNDQVAISNYYMLMGNIFRKQGLIENAKISYKEALDGFPENGSHRSLFFIYSNIADLELSLSQTTKSDKDNKLKRAIGYGIKMKQIAENLGSVVLLNRSHELLFKAYKASNDQSKALEFAELYMVSRDSLYSMQKQKAIINIQTKYETEKRDLEIELLNSDNKLMSTRLSQSIDQRDNQQTVIFLLILGFISVCIFIFVIYRFYLQTKQVNSKLILQHDIISKQQEEKEVLLKEIHHRVKNNLQLVSSLLNLQTQNIEDESIISAIADGQSRIEAMVLIHQKLYQGANVSSIDFEEYALQLLNQISGLYPELKEVEKKIVASNIELDIDTSVPVGLILSELITNAFKYSFANKTGSIAIALTKDEHDFKLVVHDSGPGLPKDFDPSTTSSIGLHLVRRLSRQLYGTSRYEYDNGSKFIVTFMDTIGRRRKE